MHRITRTNSMAIHTKLLGNELQKKGEKNQDTNLKNKSFKLTTIFFILEVSLVRLQKLSTLIQKKKDLNCFWIRTFYSLEFQLQ